MPGYLWGGPPTVVRMMKKKKQEEGKLVSSPENKREERSKGGMKGLSLVSLSMVVAVMVGFVWSLVISNALPLFIGLGVFVAIGLVDNVVLAHSRRKCDR